MMHDEYPYRLFINSNENSIFLHAERNKRKVFVFFSCVLLVLAIEKYT